jgi:hypothetical protein
MSNRKSVVPLPHGAPRVHGSLQELGEHAAQHARNRLLTACEAIAMVAALALQWKKAHAPHLSLKRALIQDGSAGAGEQAAHVLPGQLLINGKAPWALARGDKAIAAWIARFEVTAAVPTSFNTADSAAEAAGLKAAFVDACEVAWTRVSAGERNLTRTYGEFLVKANKAFNIAELNKRDTRTVASRKGNTDASDNRFIEILILRLYQVNGVTADEANRRFPLAKFIA